MDRIKIDLVPSSSLTRHECHVCGGHTGKVSILAEGHDEHGTIRVCEQCLEAGNIDERLQQHIRELDQHTDAIRTLVGRLDVPTYAAWQELIYRHDVAYFASHEMGDALGDGGVFSSVLNDDSLYARWKALYQADEAKRRATGQWPW